MKSRLGLSSAPYGSGTTALSIEFVAKPEKARSAPALLPAAINGALQAVTGFAGCLVMVSDQEARLITVVTFWTASDGQNCCNKNVRWVRALLSNYVDRCLRERTLVAHLPMVPSIRSQTNSTDVDNMTQESALTEENACVA